MKSSDALKQDAQGDGSITGGVHEPHGVALRDMVRGFGGGASTVGQDDLTGLFQP